MVWTGLYRLTEAQHDPVLSGTVSPSRKQAPLTYSLARALLVWSCAATGLGAQERAVQDSEGRDPLTYPAGWWECPGVATGCCCAGVGGWGDFRVCGLPGRLASPAWAVGGRARMDPAHLQSRAHAGAAGRQTAHD